MAMRATLHRPRCRPRARCLTDLRAPRQTLRQIRAIRTRHPRRLERHERGAQRVDQLADPGHHTSSREDKRHEPRKWEGSEVNLIEHTFDVKGGVDEESR